MTGDGGPHSSWASRGAQFRGGPPRLVPARATQREWSFPFSLSPVGDGFPGLGQQLAELANLVRIAGFVPQQVQNELTRGIVEEPAEQLGQRSAPRLNAIDQCP